jgi:hypothetical protein
MRLEPDYTGNQRSRQGTADGRRARDNARLILVFRSFKNSTQPPPRFGGQNTITLTNKVN